MRVRLLLAALAAALLTVGLVTLHPFSGGSADKHELRAEREADARGACPKGEEADRGEADRGEAEREGEGEKDAAEIAREKAFARCGDSEADIELRALTEPAEATIARQLTGADLGVNPGKFWSAARRQATAIAHVTKAADPEAFGADWVLDKPTSIGGRLLDVVVDPTQADTIFVAAATGGVWKSTDKGQRFSSVWPASLTQTIGALAIAPDGTLYAGTGEAGPGGGSITYGGTGVYKSTDRGQNWTYIGLSTTNRIGRVVVDPKDPQRIFVAGTGPLFHSGGGRGLFLSKDGGDTWEKVLAGDNATTGAVDIAIDPSDSKVVYAAMWDNFREKDRRTYEGLGSGLYRSADGGETWARVGTPFFGPRPDLGRIGVTVASDGTVYANASGVSGTYNGFYASTDGGTTWTTGAPPTVPLDSFYVYGWWFGRIYADPKDPKHVYQTGVQLQESKNGGQTFANAPGSYHADQHGMAWDPKVPARLYLANDGGAYRSDTNGGAWVKHKYLPISQINGFDVSQQDPTRMVVGLQDNGGNRNWTGSKPGNDAWADYTGGDGQRVSIAPDRQNVLYGCYQYGECVVSTDGGSTKTSFTNQVVSARKNWFTPIEFDPENSHTVYTGGEILSVSTNDGTDWTPISPDLTNGPGRETNPLFRNYGTVSTIAPAGASTKTVYAGTDDGNLWVTHDVADITAWTKAADPDLPKAWITRVAVDPRDKTGNTAYVTYSGFRQDDNAPYILRTTNGGKAWSDMTANLPAAPINDVKVIHDSVVVASDVGVFFRRAGSTAWLRLGNGLPLAPSYELRLQKASDTLFVGTFGRSAWKVDASVLG